jgi:hypothetical protein
VAKETQSLEAFRFAADNDVWLRTRTMTGFHRWLFSQHAAYAASRHTAPAALAPQAGPEAGGGGTPGVAGRGGVWAGPGDPPPWIKSY